MAYHGLSDFLEELLAAGELVRVRAAVDPELEIAEITARVAAADGPALLFDQVQGSEWAVVTNMLGTEARACRALGVPSLAALAERMSQLARPQGGPSWLDRLRGSESPPLEKFRPKPARHAASQQAVRLGRDIDLARLPALRCWPGESDRGLSGRLITMAADGQTTVIRPVQALVVERKQLAILGADVPGDGQGGEVQPRSAALVFGGDPAGSLAAALDWVPLDGFLVAGLLRNQPWEVVTARSQPVTVPADAELVIEGVLQEKVSENFLSGDIEKRFLTPFLGAHPTSGYYLDASVAAWAFEATAITHRATPVLPQVVQGDLFCGAATGEMAVLHAVRACLLKPLVQAAVPELVDCAFPLVGGRAGYVVLAIHKTYPGQARRVASAVWGLLPLERTGCVVIVDGDVDPRDAGEVLGRIAANVCPQRDVFLRAGPGSRLDHAAPQPGLAQSLGIDATAKLPPEHPRPWPTRLERPASLLDAVTRRWAELGLKKVEE